MTQNTLPVLSNNSLSRYIAEANRFPILSFEDEQMHARRWVDHQDIDSAHTLVTSHLRLVIKLAQGYRGYGLPMHDMISEGNIGLMQAVKKFDPDKGFRLSTYAMWWIKAAMNEYILKSWSLVKVGTSAAQKKLFFNLKRLKRKITTTDNVQNLLPSHISQIAQELNVSERDVVEMDARMYAHDPSMNRKMFDDSDGEYGDSFADDGPNQEMVVGDMQEKNQRHQLLMGAMEKLNQREQDIIQSRRLTDDPKTLETLAKKYQISQERVRQIEKRALEKLTQFVLEQQKQHASTQLDLPQ